MATGILSTIDGPRAGDFWHSRRERTDQRFFMSTETKAEFAARLLRAVESALGTDAFANPEGWRVAGVTLRATRGGDSRVESDTDPVIKLELPDRSLSMAVLATDPNKPAYRRTAHYDVLYHSEDNKEPHQRIFDRDRETIERFCNWIEQWDGAAPSAAS
jgi:hypothetical protein